VNSVNFRRHSTAIAGALAIAAVLTSCDLWVPQSTKTNGETSDGVSGQVGSVYVANAVLIADDDQANLVASFVNEGEQDIHLQISHGQPQATSTVNLTVGGVVQIGAENTQTVIFDGFTAEPGSLYPVYFTYQGHTGLRLDVPVLTDQQPMYRDYAPGEVQN